MRKKAARMPLKVPSMTKKAASMPVKVPRVSLSATGVALEANPLPVHASRVQGAERAR
jgi:hypothetical protein